MVKLLLLSDSFFSCCSESMISCFEGGLSPAAQRAAIKLAAEEQAVAHFLASAIASGLEFVLGGGWKKKKKDKVSFLSPLERESSVDDLDPVHDSPGQRRCQRVQEESSVP